MDDRDNIQDTQDGSLERAREKLYARKEYSVSHEQLPRYRRPERNVDRNGPATDWNIDNERTTMKHAPEKEKEFERPVISRNYRTALLAFGISFFVISTTLAGLFIIFGNRDISGGNIRISVNAPFAIGGGEEVKITANITNHNTVPITDATLIVEYPKGSEIDGERSRELIIKRYELNKIERGESINTELRARLFGEENEEKNIKISVEYHVEGSEATFYRESDLLRIVISSSPVAIVLDSDTTVVSGQEFTLTATLISNSDADLTNVLVQANYPRTFEVIKSDPAPVHGKNTWRVETLKPGEQTKITITGVFSGDPQTIQPIDVSVGFASGLDVTKPTSLLSVARAEILIEAPFLNVEITANNQTADTVVLPVEKPVKMKINITNTLTDPLYDISVVAKLSGTAVDVKKISTSEGYVDAGSKTITFDKVQDENLGQLNPGGEHSIFFSVTPSSSERTPEIMVSLDVSATRKDSSGATHAIASANKITLKFVSSVSAVAIAEHIAGSYPPRVDKNTTYRVLLSVQGGGNETVGATLKAVIPRGVSISGSLPNDITWSESARSITWNIGTIPANDSRINEVSLDYTPSSLDLGSTPIIMRDLNVTGTDRFTGQSVTVSLQSIITTVGDGSVSGQVTE